MSADFWAGYISGAAGIILGNPLDILKVRLQATSSSPVPTPPSSSLPTTTTTTTHPASVSATSTARAIAKTPPSHFLLGTAFPVLGYGALNALLFVTYNRTEALLNGTTPTNTTTTGSNLYTTWLAGAAGGLATWVVSTPTELVKCRAQLQGSSPSPSPSASSPSAGRTVAGAGKTSSWNIAKQVLRHEGVRGLYFGGMVTALRDSVGYGFYFWGYELATRWWIAAVGNGEGRDGNGNGGVMGSEAMRVLVCGGLAGIVTWASIFPLDVIKTRVQTQVLEQGGVGERAALLEGGKGRRLGAWEVAKETYREGGVRPFFRGLLVCSVRAFIVNAVQWAVYEWIMMELGQGRKRQDPLELGPGSG